MRKSTSPVLFFTDALSACRPLNALLRTFSSPFLKKLTNNLQIIGCKAKFKKNKHQPRANLSACISTLCYLCVIDRFSLDSSSSSIRHFRETPCDLRLKQIKTQIQLACLWKIQSPRMQLTQKSKFLFQLFDFLAYRHAFHFLISIAFWFYQKYLFLFL